MVTIILVVISTYYYSYILILVEVFLSSSPCPANAIIHLCVCVCVSGTVHPLCIPILLLPSHLPQSCPLPRPSPSVSLAPGTLSTPLASASHPGLARTGTGQGAVAQRALWIEMSTKALSPYPYGATPEVLQELRSSQEPGNHLLSIHHLLAGLFKTPAMKTRGFRLGEGAQGRHLHEWRKEALWPPSRASGLQLAVVRTEAPLKRPVATWGQTSPSSDPTSEP